MTGSKGIIAGLIVLVLAVAGYWYYTQDQVEVPTAALETPAAHTDGSRETSGSTDSAAQPQATAGSTAETPASQENFTKSDHWICTAWDSNAAVQSDETCIQWSINRGAQTD